MDGEAGTLHAQCGRRQDGARDYSVPYGAEEREDAPKTGDIESETESIRKTRYFKIMDKLKMQTTDGVQDNISRIAELFPECITEVSNQMGGGKTFR